MPCSICKMTGHNAKTCGSKPVTASAGAGTVAKPVAATKATDVEPGVYYILHFTRRAHSSGSETKWKKQVNSLAKAREHLLKEFADYMADNFYPECWDPSDMFEYRGGRRAPMPSMELAERLFSIKNLKSKLLSGNLYGPYSEYECQVPYEISINRCRK